MRRTHSIKMVIQDNRTGVEYETAMTLVTADSFEAAQDGLNWVYELVQETADTMPFHLNDLEN